jgi:hypothetical protein
MKVTPFQAQLITSLVTLAAALGGAYVNSVTREKRERAARKGERRQTFEQETLLDLQDGLETLHRFMERYRTERFPSEMDDDEQASALKDLPEEFRLSQASVDKLRERALDDEARRLVTRVQMAARSALLSRSRREFAEKEKEFQASFKNAAARLGKLIRELFRA